jgi:ketosteroid isomerase-like protein
MRHSPSFAVALSALLAGCSAGGSSASLNAADSAAILAAQAEFAAAWLRDDTTGVLAILDSAVVLLPPGGRPVNGHAAVRAYWWPNDGSRTRITGFNWTTDEIAGSGSLAYLRGISSLAWTYDKDTVHQGNTARSQSLILLRRDANGRWLFVRQMWSPTPR